MCGVPTELLVTVVGAVVEDISVASVAAVASVVALVVAVEVVVGCGFVVGVVVSVVTSVVAAGVVVGAVVPGVLPDVDGCELPHAPIVKLATISHPPPRHAPVCPFPTQRLYMDRRRLDPTPRSARALTASSASRRISA